MWGVGTRRQLSRLFLSFSSSETLRFRLLLALLLGLLSCGGGHARSESSDPIRRLVDQPERRHPEGKLDIKRRWTQWIFRKSETSTRSSEHLYYHFADSPEDPNERENWLRFVPYGRDHRNRGTIEIPSHQDYWGNSLVKRGGEGLKSGSVNDDYSTISDLGEEFLKSTSDQRKIQTFLNRQKADDAVDKIISDASTSSGPCFMTCEGERSGTDFLEEFRNSLKNSQQERDPMNHEAGIPGAAEREIKHKTTRKTRLNRSKLSINKQQLEETEVKNSQKVIPSLLPSNDSEESIDPPFTGFEGSQKFPMKVTYKPPAVQQVEKFDRRHFKPPKVEVTEETWYLTTSAPDLPKSPSRDRRPKVDKSVEEVGRIESTPEGSEGENSTTDDSFVFENTTPETSFAESSGKNFPRDQSTLSPWRGSSAGPSTGANGSESKDDNEASAVTAPPPPVKSTEKINVTILGLFEMTQGSEPRPEGPSELQAARLAVQRVNQMNILPKFRLRLIHNDTKCDAGVGVDRFFHALYSSSKDELMPLLLGTACSEVSETLAKIVPYWNIVQVSFGSTAPALSDTTEFPLFIRTVAPDSSHNPARIALVKHFGWDTVTALSQTGDMYSLAVNDLVTELEQANITCTATITFAENDYKEQLRTLKELDTRIIIGSFSPRLAPRVFCEAWKLGMHGGDYAWILPDDTIDLSGMTGDWWHPGPEECSPSQLTQTLDGLIIVKSHATVFGNEISSSGLTGAEFTSELAKRGVTHSRFAGQTYDAVWAMALALARTEVLLNLKNTSMTEYSHNKKDLAQLLLEQLRLLQFIGVSGPVSFDGADRVGITAFYQMQGHAIRRIAIFTPKDGELIMNCPGCVATRWPGGHPPAARRVFRLRLVTVAPAAFLAVTCLASVGVTLALAFLAFNLHFRKHKSIKLSSPRLNNMAAVGCGLVYGAVILLGLDHATLPDSDGYFPAVCTARVYLLSAGFSLAFGSMFTKTYRVHKIFTRSRSGVVKNKLLQDTQLISLICVLLLIDGLVVTLWVTLDPMQRHLRNLTLEINPQDRGVVYQPQVEVCRSQHTNGWLGALYAYKGLLLVVGVYMAWETRHVKIPALNDSQYIGMSVYSVVITSGIVVVLANLMSDRATLAFVTITALILASTTSTLALLFLPQLAHILAGERADPVIQSLGLKIECNTRRFVTDDRSELQYRVEVQNRVYRREMAQLELELARLEKQLGQEPVEASHASSNTSLPQRNPSIGGGLPLLLLSVLPPVIPRASWPSADPAGMRRGTVAFSSQPDLEPDGPRRSLADIYKLHHRRETEGPNRLGVFQRLFSLFGSRPASRKTSTASFSGVASALRVHMGYIAGLVPGAKAASTCQVDTQGTRSPQPRCGSGPIISITSEEDRRLSLGLRRKESSEPRVNFSLPPQASASQTSSREKIKGSPRFPHRIVPANSLGTIPPGTFTTKPQRWHSMEDARKPKTLTAGRGPSCSPNSDVWATREVGIPLSEFLRTNGAKKRPETLPLTITADSDVSPDEGRLGNDLRKLFREIDTHSAVASPLESERDYLEPILTPSPSQITLKVSTAESNNSSCSNESYSDSTETTGQNTSVKFLHDAEHLRLGASGQKTSAVSPTEMKSSATLPTNFRTDILNDEAVCRNGKVRANEQEYSRLSGPKVIVTHSTEVKLLPSSPTSRDISSSKNETSSSAASQGSATMFLRESTLSHPSSPKKVASRHSKLRSSSSSPTTLRMLTTPGDVGLYGKEFRSESFLGIGAQKVEAALLQEPQFSRPSSPKMIVTNSPIDESVEHEDRTASQSDSGEPAVV